MTCFRVLVHLSRREGSRERGLRQSERSKPGTSEPRPSPSQNVGINKAVYVGTTLPRESHTTPHVRALLAAAGPMTWQANPRQGVGDDVAPTSLNKGRGEVVMKALVVAFYLGQKHYPVDRWASGGPVVAEGKAGSPNAETRKRAILGKDANGISHAQRQKP
jgi:hypothetical protein